MIASRTGNVDIVRVLLGAGADVNCVSRTVSVYNASRQHACNLFLFTTTQVRSTALFDAASGGSTEVVRLLLTCDGIDVDLKDKVKYWLVSLVIFAPSMIIVLLLSPL